MREITKIRTSKKTPDSIQVPHFMSLPKIFVRRNGSKLVARWIPEGSPVDGSGMPFCHSFTGKTMKDIERQIRAAGCKARIEFDDCDGYLN